MLEWETGVSSMGAEGVDVFTLEAQFDDEFTQWCLAKLFSLWILSRYYMSEEILLDSVKLNFLHFLKQKLDKSA